MILKKVLLINGISSGATGLLLTLMHQVFANVFEVEMTTPFLATGIFLILFSVIVLASAIVKPIRPNAVRTITALDILWVLGSIICVGALYATISGWGSFLISAVGLWVGLMAYLQLRFLKNI